MNKQTTDDFSHERHFSFLVDIIHMYSWAFHAGGCLIHTYYGYDFFESALHTY